MRITAVALSLIASALVAPASPAGAAAVPRCHGIRATIVGTPAADVIHGTARRDVIVGLGGSDTILARGGDDLVCGGRGSDHLDGGRGDDRLYGGKDGLHHAQEDGIERSGDVLSGGPGDDRLDVGVDRRPADLVTHDVVSWEDAARGVHIDLRTQTARGEGHDTLVGRPVTVIGSAHGDVVRGSRGPDRIETRGGPDVIRAGAGSDLVLADDYQQRNADADRVWGGPGRDRLWTTRGRDRLVGGPGDDWLETGRNNHVVQLGGTGDDSLDVDVPDSTGPQRFDGGPGSDYAQVNTGDINPHRSASTGTWDMASGDMTFTLDGTVSLSVIRIERAALATSGTSWTITGTAGDNLIGSDANGTAPVSFYGRKGDDVFRGTDGDDLFDGGPGHDRSAAMFDGDDTCISVEVFDYDECENVSP